MGFLGLNDCIMKLKKLPCGKNIFHCSLSSMYMRSMSIGRSGIVFTNPPTHMYQGQHAESRRDRYEDISSIPRGVEYDMLGCAPLCLMLNILYKVVYVHYKLALSLPSVVDSKMNTERLAMSSITLGRTNLTGPSVQSGLLGIPSPQNPLRLTIRPLIRVGSRRRRPELFIAGNLLRSIRQVQSGTVIGPRLLHRLRTQFPRLFIYVQRMGNIVSRRDSRQKDTQSCCVFDCLRRTLCHVRAISG